MRTTTPSCHRPLPLSFLLSHLLALRPSTGVMEVVLYVRGTIQYRTGTTSSLPVTIVRGGGGGGWGGVERGPRA